MAERWIWLGAGLAAVVTLGAARVDPLVVEGPELFPGLEASAAVLRTASSCEPDCRAVAAAELTLPEGSGWALRGEPELVARADRARLFVLATGPDGQQRWFGSPRVNLAGGPRRVVVPAEVAGWRVEAGAILVGPGGELNVGPLSLRAARPSKLHFAVWWAAVAAWGAAGLAAAAQLGRSLDGRGRLTLLGLLGAFGLGILMPREWLDAVLLGLPGVGVDDLAVLQKGAGHGGGFALLGLLSGLAGGVTLPVVARVAAFAAATELVQLLTETRSGSFVDLGIDLAGAGVGLALAGLTSARGAPRAR